MTGTRKLTKRYSTAIVPAVLCLTAIVFLFRARQGLPTILGVTLSHFLLIAWAILTFLWLIWAFLAVKWDWDREQNRGAAVIVAVSFALLGGVAMLFWNDGPPVVRVVVPLSILIAAIWVASTNWRPQSLRLVAVVGVLFILGSLVTIGRDANDPADRATDELDSVESTLAQMEEPLKERIGLLQSAQGESAKALEEQITATRNAAAANLNEPHVTNAEAVHAAILADDPEELKRVLTVFDNDYPADPRPVLEDLKEAVYLAAAAYSAAASPPTKDEVALAVESARTAVEAEDGLPVTMAIVRLRLAEYRRDVFQREEDSEHVKAAEEALKAARATSPEWEPRVVGVSEAIGLGVKEVLSNASASDDSEDALALEALGWVVLAALAIAFWRQVECRSASQLPGPVSVDPIPFKSGSVDTSDLQRAVFRTALLRNISEPAGIPGATVLKSLTDLAELAAPAQSWLAPLATAVRGVLEAPAGYAVRAEVVPKEGKSDAFRVLVRISDRSSGRDVTVASITGASAPEACRAAGYWAAAAVLERSSRTPGWARWTPAGATALATLDDSGDVGSAELPSSELANASAKAPDSGVLLHKRADILDLDGKHFEALSLYARAVAAHPRFPEARYRLAVSVNIVADDVEKQWLTAPASARTRVIAQLQRACEGMGLAPEYVDTIGGLGRNPDNIKSDLETLAGALFKQLQNDSTLPRIVSQALRKSERDVFWPPGIGKFGPGGPRVRALWIIRSAMLSISALDNEGLRNEVVQRASRGGSWWQLCYNLACYHALKQNPEEALEWLETALERPGGGQMAGGWLGVDPDLRNIWTAPRFRWLLQQVDDTRKKAEVNA